MSKFGNLFDLSTMGNQKEECFEVLLSLSGSESSGGVVIERIVSNGKSSPEGFWYDQLHTEWVMVLKGSALIAIEGEDLRPMLPGEWCLFLPHCRHRVEEVSEDCVWLAIHCHPTT